MFCELEYPVHICHIYMAYAFFKKKNGWDWCILVYTKNVEEEHSNLSHRLLHYRKKIWNIWKAQWKHSHLPCWVAGHDLASTTLTHWGRVTHICVNKLTIIGSDNCLAPGRRQAIIWTSAGILLIGSLGTNFSEILIGIQIFSFKKMHFKTSSAK